MGIDVLVEISFLVDLRSDYALSLVGGDFVSARVDRKPLGWSNWTVRCWIDVALHHMRGLAGSSASRYSGREAGFR